MTTTTHKVFNLIILDESGSMSSIKSSTISGFNEVVETIKSLEKEFPDQKHFISLITFNSGTIKDLLLLKPVSELNAINENLYHPRESTPLYDAMGHGITQLKAAIKDEPEYNVLVTIITDGQENSSKEFTGIAIKKLVDELKSDGWTFTYIGANHNVESFAATLSINNTMQFSANDADVKFTFNKDKSARIRMSHEIAALKHIGLNKKMVIGKGFFDEEKK